MIGPLLYVVGVGVSLLLLSRRDCDWRPFFMLFLLEGYSPQAPMAAKRLAVLAQAPIVVEIVRPCPPPPQSFLLLSFAAIA